MSWVDTWDRTAAAVMAALIQKMPIDEAAKAAHDAADALLAEMNRRDAERREARERREQRSAEFERVWNTLDAHLHYLEMVRQGMIRDFEVVR